MLEETIPVQRIWLEAAETGEHAKGGFTAENVEAVMDVLTVLYRNLVAKKGLSPQEAKSQLLKTEPFDLLLTDIVMPEMDGIELAQKAAQIAPDIRVMFITGFAAVALKAGRKAPDAKVLSKPFHLKDLVAEVERMFQSEDQHGRL